MGRQRLGDHLTGGLMDPHMQFAPSPPFGPAVLTDFPLVFAPHRRLSSSWASTPTCSQSAYDGLSTRPLKVHRFIGALGRQHHRQVPLATRQGRVIRRRQFQLHQVQKRLDKALRLAQRQPKQHPHRQHPFNRWIRIYKLSTPLRRPLIIPLLPQRIVQPDRQATAGDQRPIIRRPIFDPIHRFRLEPPDILLITGSQGREVRVSCWKSRTNLTGEPDSVQDPIESCKYKGQFKLCILEEASNQVVIGAGR